MTAFDLAALLILVVSALIGFSRGAVRELVTVFAFTLAAVIALYALPVSAPLMRHVMHPAWAGAAAAVILVFVIGYVALRVLGAAITTHLHASSFGVINRGLGGVFGAVRALVVLGAFALVFSAVTPQTMQPRWIVGGFTWPISKMSGRALAMFAPKGAGLVGGLSHGVGDNVKKSFSASDDETTNSTETSADRPDASESTSTRTRKTTKSQSSSYDTQDRRRLNVLVERAR